MGSGQFSAVSKPFQIRGYLVTPQRNSIKGPNGETGIEPKVMAVLCVLAAEPGRVFARTELIDLVWGTEFGADESLTRSISLLRKALGDTKSEPGVIETIPKRGYCLLPLGMQDAEVPQPQRSALVSVRRREWIAAMVFAVAGLAFWQLRIWPFARGVEGSTQSAIQVTVLPFNPVQKEAPQKSLATALTVDLVGALAKEKQLNVTVRHPDSAIPRGTARRYSIYADLQTSDGLVKADVEIMDLDSGQALWSRLYERPFDGKLSSQDQLSAHIAQDLTAALLAMGHGQSR